MQFNKKKLLVLASAVYWFLLVYIIAALIWWFIALDHQNQQMADYRVNELQHDAPDFNSRYEQIMEDKKRKTAQYIGEGSTFLALTILASLFVYRAVRKQIRLQQQQENFMTAITHELKTPVAIAKLNLETLQKHHLDDSRRQKLLQATLQETNRLDTLVSNILVSSQLEGDRYGSSKEELDFSALVQDTVQQFRNRYSTNHFIAELEPDIDLKGDALLLQILVSNLLENAVKYTPQSGAITCRLHRNQHTILLEIADQGPGIPVAEKKKVFDKFYRIGNEAIRTTKGTGLGLYLCARIARDHHASIQIRDNSPAGCNFTVSFKV